MHATFILLLICCFVLTGTGCVHFDNYAQFMRVAQTSTTAGPAMTAEVVDVPDFEITHLLLGISQTSNRPPFALSFESEDPAGQYEAMVIRKIEVVFADDSPGTQIQLDRSVPFVNDKYDEREARWVVDDAVPREGDFRAQVHGHFLRRDGTQQPFTFVFQFESDHRYGILPAIVVLNGV